MKTTIIAISDLHGRLPDVPKCDILVIAGDLCPATNHRLEYQAWWLCGTFAEWCRRQPTDKIIAVPGNHDWIMQKEPKYLWNLPEVWTVLIDESYEYRGIKFHGTPWQLIFNNWAFNLDEEGLAKKYTLIPPDTNVLISHGPPFGYLDTVNTRPFEHLGSKALAETTAELNIPLTIFGHIHSGHGIQLHQGRYYVNASILNESYHQVYAPIKIEFEGNRLLSVEQL